MLFKTTIAACAVAGAFAAPTYQRINENINEGITVSLIGKKTLAFSGFSAAAPSNFSSPPEEGPFSQVRISFGAAIKEQFPGIENSFRCALEGQTGNRLVVTRGNNVDFNFGDNGNPAAWTIKDGPVKMVNIKCDPSFTKINANDVNLVRVLVSDSSSEFARATEFDASEVTQAVTANLAGAFKTVQLTVGPGVDNQKLRCQLKGPNGEIILADRGANKNKETFGDAGKGEWVLNGGQVATVATVTCDPTFQ